MSDSPVIDLFKENDLVKVCAPMVRYSKLAFRTLVRKYSCQLCFTPMIIADSFIRSSKARNVEFITNKDDRPLIVQFAAKDSNELGKAAEIVANYSDGVDLNCGCPQHWAMKDGYGAELLKTPHLIRDMVLQVKNRIPGPYTVSVKLRILEDMRKNIDLCRTLENAGVSFITVHARTPIQRNQAINVDALREIKNSIGVPLIANGDVKSLFGAEILQKKCGCNEISETAAQAEVLSSSPSPETFTPGKSIQLPANGIGTWREISLSRRSNAQSWEHDGRSLGVSSSASWMVYMSSLHNSNICAWVLSSIICLLINYS